MCCLRSSIDIFVLSERWRYMLLVLLLFVLHCGLSLHNKLTWWWWWWWWHTYTHTHGFFVNIYFKKNINTWLREINVYFLNCSLYTSWRRCDTSEQKKITNSDIAQQKLINILTYLLTYLLSFFLSFFLSYQFSSVTLSPAIVISVKCSRTRIFFL